MVRPLSQKQDQKQNSWARPSIGDGLKMLHRSDFPPGPDTTAYVTGKTEVPLPGQATGTHTCTREVH